MFESVYEYINLNMKNSDYEKIVWVIILQICIAGCVRDEPTEEDKKTVKVEITDLLPDSLGDFGNLKMRSVSLTFYSLTDETVTSQTLTGSSGEAKIPNGQYSLLIYSSDFFELDGLFYRGMNRPNTAEAYARQYTRSDKSIFMYEPDPLFCFYVDNIDTNSLNANGRSASTPSLFSVTLSPLVYKYRFQIIVEGIKYLHSATAIVTGLYASVFLKDGHHRDEEVAQQVVLRKKTDASGVDYIYGEFLSFGSNQRKDVNHHIYIVLNIDETKIVDLGNLTEEIKKLPCGGEIKINQKIVIHGSGEEPGGVFDPVVTDWDDVVIPLPI